MANPADQKDPKVDHGAKPKTSSGQVAPSHADVAAQAVDPSAINKAQTLARRGKSIGAVMTKPLLGRKSSKAAPADAQNADNTTLNNPNSAAASMNTETSLYQGQEEGPALPSALGGFPTVRMRRNRKNDWTRRLVAESSLSVDDLIWPIFVQEEQGATQIPSMPGVVRFGPDTLLQAVNEAYELGIPAVALFPEVPQDLKSVTCEEAVNPENLVCRSVRAIKETFDDLGVMCDVALDPYNATGQDGLVDLSDETNPVILNDETLEMLVDQALVQAQAGCDVIAPSDMMDGRIGAIRTGMDEAGYEMVSIMSYAAKYASSFYGPFRDAVGSGSVLKGDKRTYQMDPANGREALREVELDIAEGADMIMVKPGMPYLDVVKAVSDAYTTPVYAYQVSGEYAMMAAAAENGWLDGAKVMMESLLAFKRAGAKGILTYAAVDVARELSL